MSQIRWDYLGAEAVSERSELSAESVGWGAGFALDFAFGFDLAFVLELDAVLEVPCLGTVLDVPCLVGDSAPGRL